MDALPKNAALIVVDVQQGFDTYDLPRSNPYAEANMRTILWAWRMAKRPVFHVRHDSLEAESTLKQGNPGYAFKLGFKPYSNEPHIVKRVNSAFIGTDLKARLRKQGFETLVFIGLTTNHCVSTSVRMASNFGFKTYIVDDATAAFETQYDGRPIPPKMVHEVAISNLSAEFATVINTEELYAEVRSHNSRQRATLLITQNDQLLLMYRNKRGKEYFTLPGGGIERGESAEQAAIREAKEETGLDIVINKEISCYADREHRFVIREFSGELQVGGPEAERASETNIYRLEWIPFSRLNDVNLIAPVASFISHL